MQVADIIMRIADIIVRTYCWSERCHDHPQHVWVYKREESGETVIVRRCPEHERIDALTEAR